MCRQTITILVAGWSLVAVPALCLGGLLDHACHCAGRSCSHEEGCSSDPCAQIGNAASRHTPSCVESFCALAAWIISPTVPGAANPIEAIRARRIAALAGEIGPGGSAMHASDFPILV